MASPRGSSWYIAGSCVVIALGLVHTMAIFSKPVAANETERQLLTLMTDYKQDLMGTMRSTSEIVQGFNVSLTLFCLALGALNIILVQRLHENPALLRTLAFVNVGWLAAMLANSLLYWFIAPTSFLAIAFLCFGVAWLRMRPAA